MSLNPTARAKPAIPQHVAVIMDGNGRWAEMRHLPRLEGHRRGAHALEETVDGALECGVKYLTLYAFSIENWNRPHAEVAGLMQLLNHTLISQSKKLMERDIRLRVMGRMQDLPESTQKVLTDLIQKTEKHQSLQLIMALSYSSRMEMVEAMRQMALKVKQGELEPETIDEKMISQHLYLPDVPDPDFLIRTSGEQRLSNFLLWQLSYTELYITPRLWPDFTKEDFKEALADFARRRRRFGGL